MRHWFNRQLAGVSLPVVLATLALGAAGGGAAMALHLPLGMLLGALMAVGVASALGARVGGRPLAVPQHWRFALVPVIGVAIGASFTPALVAQAPRWAFSIGALLVFVPLAHVMGYLIFARWGGLARPTAFYAAMPGGLMESLHLGEEAGADIQMLTLLQFLRLILCIVLVPVIFTIGTGHAVGSAAGTAMPGADVTAGPVDWLVMIAAGVIGMIGGKAARLPAHIIVGPILASAAAHMAGLTAAAPPGWTILVTQWVVGTSLGARFAGIRGRTLWLALRLSLAAAAAMLTMGYGAALALHGLVDQPVAALFLAYAPGGISEMSLVALSLQISAVFVSVHHVVRVMIAIAMARFLAGRLLR